VRKNFDARSQAHLAQYARVLIFATEERAPAPRAASRSQNHLFHRFSGRIEAAI
jgi:hypothetical protein